MVSSLLVDAINNPSSALQELYESETHGSNFPAYVATHFSEIFSTINAFQQIPPLSLKNPPDVFKDRALVRFRGMVQDTPSSSEMYLSRFPDGKCGGWALPSDNQVDAVDYNDLAECNAFWGVTIPGETDWSANGLDGEDAATSSPITGRQKGSRAHKCPYPDLPCLGVNIKVYDKAAAQSLKPTDVVTFVGILTKEAIVSDVIDDAIEVHTLHVLFTRPHTQPYPFPASNDSVHDDLVDWIAEEGLGGDRDAAEWVLLACIARVQSRQPALLPPTLAVTRFPAPKSTSKTPALFHVLSELLSLALILPLSLDVLNKGQFAPESKDEDLHSGFLQVPSGSMILITESDIAEGILNERGITNLRAIQEVMTSQTLEYVFPFSRFSFNTETNFIVLSEGKKGAFFKTDLIIALSVVQSEREELYKTKKEIRMPTQEKLESFRQLVGGAKAGAKLQVGDDMSKHIEEEFVRERKIDPTITHNDLVTRLTLAKLLTLALHREELTEDIWEKAKKLDERRKSRLL